MMGGAVQVVHWAVAISSSDDARSGRDDARSGRDDAMSNRQGRCELMHVWQLDVNDHPSKP